MKKRVPLQVDPTFRDLLRRIQGELMLNGQNKSLREITSDLVKSGMISAEQMKKEVTIRMDKRRNHV